MSLGWSCILPGLYHVEVKRVQHDTFLASVIVGGYKTPAGIVIRSVNPAQLQDYLADVVGGHRSAT